MLRRLPLWPVLWTLLLVSGGIALVGPVHAQEDAAVRVALRGDSAYVYHTAILPAGHGFHLERISDGGDTTRVTDAPVLGIQAPDRLPALLGERYDALRNQLEVDTPLDLYLALRSDRTTRRLSLFLYPEVGRQLGHLAIDATAPIGTPVTYRFVFVDGTGAPTGRTLSQRVPLERTERPAPTDLEAEHTGRTVTLSWTYPQAPPDTDDTIIRFAVYRLDTLRAEDGTADVVPEPVHGDAVILRNNAVSDFEYTFDVPRTGATETFFVAAVSITGEETPSERIAYEVTDNVPPPMLADVRTVVGDSLPTAELTWPVSPAPDAAGYHVYRAPRMEAEFQRLTAAPLDVLSTVYLDTTVTGGESFFYRVSVVDEAGNESPRSNPVMAQVTDRVPPPTPRALTAAFQEDGTVQLRWTTDATPPDLWTYRVLRRRLDQGDLPFAQANTTVVQDTAFTDRGGDQRTDAARFDEGARYRYALVAADSARNFSDSVFVDVTIPDRTAPPPPNQLSAINDGGLRAVLRWAPGATADITEYVVYRRTNQPAAEDSAIARVPHPQLSTQDDSVTVGTTYVYTVTAVDSLGNESPRTRTATLQMRDLDPPPAVRNVQAFRQNGATTVRWDPSPSSDVAGYRVYRADLATGIYEPIGPLVTETQTTVPPDDENVFYRVHAVDTSGNESRPSVPARRVVVTAEN